MHLSTKYPVMRNIYLCPLISRKLSQQDWKTAREVHYQWSLILLPDIPIGFGLSLGLTAYVSISCCLLSVRCCHLLAHANRSRVLFPSAVWNTYTGCQLCHRNCGLLQFGILLQMGDNADVLKIFWYFFFQYKPFSRRSWFFPTDLRRSLIISYRP